MAKHGKPLGIDIGGSGIKGAPVDLVDGDLAGKRLKILTPKPATPDAVAEVVDQIVDHFADVTGDSPIGVTVPAVVIRGTVLSAANIDPSWINTDAEALIQEHTGRAVTVLNDADAAGLAEMYYGAAKGVQGLVILTTLGTGIGTALIHDGRLVPNSELGHLEIDGYDAEDRAASSVKDAEGLSWDERGGTPGPGRALLPAGSGPVGSDVGGEVGSADDAGLVAQLGRDDRAAQRELRQEVVAVLGDASADDDEVGGEELLDRVVVGLEALDVLVPRPVSYTHLTLPTICSV